MWQRHHEFFSCLEKGETENNKWNTLEFITFQHEKDTFCSQYGYIMS